MSNIDEIAIGINDIHKEFVLPQSKNSSFKQAAVNIVKKNNKVTQKVLDGVSFDINKGDFFGIVGRNGSGKSTLLKLIAGVYTPTSGSIELNGGLTPFIELGVGFNPEISGRDNVYLNGALLGFTRNQVDEFYDDVVEFAELGPFMDQKLKNYSSGMQVRLAFAIA
ncbi:MAG: ATP-binding cassette domain-containing protein, partial [Candidatus Saccharimonadales bacterium]